MTPTDRKIKIMHRVYTSNVQRLTEDIIEMSQKTDQAIRQLEAVEMMTNTYREYLAVAKQGGDWTLPKFMQHLNETTKKARQALEEKIINGSDNI